MNLLIVHVLLLIVHPLQDIQQILFLFIQSSARFQQSLNPVKISLEPPQLLPQVGADFFVRVSPLETERLMRLGSAAPVCSGPLAFQLTAEPVDESALTRASSRMLVSFGKRMFTGAQVASRMRVPSLGSLFSEF